MDFDIYIPFMYHMSHGRFMWEAEPYLEWRVKRNGKWKRERAYYVVIEEDWHESGQVVRLYWPKPPMGESE